MGILSACMFVYYIYAWCWQRPEKVLGSLELESQVASYYEGAGNETQILCALNL